MDAADTPRLRAAVRTAGEWHWAWGLYVGGVGIATITAVLMPNNRGGNPSIVAAAMAAIVVCVLTVGRPVLRSDKSTWQSWVLVGVVVALSLLAISCSPVVDAPVPVAMAAVPAIYPVIYTSLPMWAAPVVTIAVTVTPLIMVLTAGRPISTDIPLVFGVTLIGVIAAPVIGTLGALATRQRTKLAAVVKELAASRAESARLSSEAGAAAERERLAREIHDTLAQGYTSIVALSQAVEAELDSDRAAADRHLELIRTTARENLAEARVIVAGLSPTVLGEGSLAAAIRRQCDKLTAETGIAVKFSADRDLPTLGMAADVVLLRATQEALANIRKHAQASAVCAKLSAVANGVRLTLADNGIGLSSDHPEGFGLRGMKARVAQVGGTMRVSRTPGGGVTIDIEVPA
ncbi:sensor histidine kinase [Mycobacterium kyorinense]|uniref:histidine kinase n=1 Tax=Mycobacterium kyorinense TaxID=487514 RepID=A0A1X1XJH8_9MYCO|nr:sensor histidine kinase [Mycobacterium kyorinense]ORV99017.1 histidine kinase [Mycobacterium kyorinense]